MPKQLFLRCALLSAALLAAVVASGQQAPGPAGQKPSETPPAAKTKPRPRVVQDLSGFELTDPEKLKHETMFIGATRGFGGAPLPPEALAPRLGRVYSAQPEFVWTFSGPPGESFFVLADDSGHELLKAPLKAEQRSYALAGATLATGKSYRWHIEVRSDSGQPLRSKPAGLVIVTEAERQKIDAALVQIAAGNSYEQQLARARVFRDFRLWYDALAAYTELIARYSERAELYEERGMIYAQIPVARKLADADFARADDLKGKRGKPGNSAP
jgi:hypothetical protein